MKRSSILVPITCVMLIVGGCAQPPTEQITAAELAVKEAQASGAAVYIADDYVKLEGTLAAIKKEVAEQDGKFALFRDYGKVDQLVTAVKSDAERLKSEALKKMEEAKTAAVQAQHVAQDAVKSTIDLVAKAPAGKDRAALEAIKTDAEALKASLIDVQMSIDKADYIGAQSKAKAIHEKSQAVSHEIETAMAKVSKAKPVAAKPKKK